MGKPNIKTKTAMDSVNLFADSAACRLSFKLESCGINTHKTRAITTTVIISVELTTKNFLSRDLLKYLDLSDSLTIYGFKYITV